MNAVGSAGCGVAIAGPPSRIHTQPGRGPEANGVQWWSNQLVTVLSTVRLFPGEQCTGASRSVDWSLNRGLPQQGSLLYHIRGCEYARSPVQPRCRMHSWRAGASK
jgi:hypothetical protein